MALNGKLLRSDLIVVGVIVLILAASVASQPNSTCERRCGLVDIPYPFGTSEDCSLDSTFLITCNNGFLSLGSDMNVTEISLDGELRVSNPVASLCREYVNHSHTSSINERSTSHMTGKATATVIACSGGSAHSRCISGKNSYRNSISVNYSDNSASLKLSNFRISNKKNKITAVGCGVYSYIQGYEEEKAFTTGCMSLCTDNASDVVNGSCSGIGCCETSVSKGATEFNLSVRVMDDDTKTIAPGECALGFIVEDQAYNFSSLDVKNFKARKMTHVPLVLDWAVGNETCEEAMKNNEGYACKAIHSYCKNCSNGSGYRCNCFPGYRGNPYLPDDCKDINECEQTPYPCAGNATCINTEGNYTCICRHGYEGNGRTSCTLKAESQPRIIPISIGISTSFGVIFLLFGGWWSYKLTRKRKMIKQKKKFFNRNGGLLLQKQLSSSDVNVESNKLFSSKDLEEATDRFNVNRILGKGGQGTVYKGMLSDGRIVAVKRSVMIDEEKLEEFVNEVVILSRINHRNVVKLLGCCLETEVPLLVYEFIPNGTLAQYLSNQNDEFPPTWAMRLRIATEVAGALFYLHSAASSPIYHRDIKTSNILLDEKYRAKVADFGTSRSIAIDQTHLTTLVHGTFGYLDPEYFQSSQFTEKSDVYSFGVVLAELLTGEKAISFERTLETKSLATYFLNSMEENNLFDILDSRVLKDADKEEVITVGNLVKRCLNLNGKKRPTMKEVAKELEAVLQMSQKASNIHQNSVEFLLKNEIVNPNDVVSTSTSAGMDAGIATSLDDKPLLSS